MINLTADRYQLNIIVFKHIFKFYIYFTELGDQNIKTRNGCCQSIKKQLSRGME
jgi:hypothetical protein